MRRSQSVEYISERKMYPEFLSDRERFFIFGGIDPHYSAGDADQSSYIMKSKGGQCGSQNSGYTRNLQDISFSHFFCIFFGHIFRIIHAIFCVAVALFPNIELFWFSIRFLAESTTKLFTINDIAEFLLQCFVFSIRICIVGMGLLINLGIMFYPLTLIFALCFKI